jgi:hypothetical protein
MSFKILSQENMNLILEIALILELLDHLTRISSLNYLSRTLNRETYFRIQYYKKGSNK